VIIAQLLNALHGLPIVFWKWEITAAKAESN